MVVVRGPIDMVRLPGHRTMATTRGETAPAGSVSERETTAMKVGFIGVGNMGGPMCRNIIRNTNHEVVVFDLSAAR